MKIGVIGLGLIGGSFCKTVKKNSDYLVFGYDINELTVLKAQMTNAIDGVLDETSVLGVDLLIVATNPNVFESAVKRFLPLLKDGATVIDFCGTKTSVVLAMQNMAKTYKNIKFFGGHPMAGREFSGFDRSTSTLFSKASMILVPVSSDIFDNDRVKKLFLELGFLEVVFTTSENHDKVIAYTSQLCHIVSNAFIKSETSQKHYGYSAGSYKDLTRVARLDSEMWSVLMLENKDNLLNELETLINNLQVYKEALKNGDKLALKTALQEGNDIKIAIDFSNTKQK
ncbi:MAG: prephenate dehydrogenase [Clostridia bacterium]|nr:prephenate dehydrogenase [Clostridia bacterium]